MTQPFHENMLVRDIVNIFPKSSDVFKKNQIDFCCGGNVPLHEAAARKSIDVKDLITELKDLYANHPAGPEDMEFWTQTPSNKLVWHIQERYHRATEEELKQMSPYVTKVMNVHGENHPELVKVYELFQKLKEEMIEHMKKEEAETFPKLLSLDEPSTENQDKIIEEILLLEKEHDFTGALLEELRDVTNQFTPPAEACGTYRLVYKRLDELESHTLMHIHLENNILFPRYFER